MRVRDNGAGEERKVVFYFPVNLRMVLRHLLVQILIEEIQDREFFTEHAHTEIIVPGELIIVRHLSQNTQKSFQGLRGVQIQSLQSSGTSVVLIAIDFDSEVSDHGQVSRTTSKNGVEKLGIALSRDFFEIACMVHNLERQDLVTKKAETASQLSKSTSLDMSAEMDIFASVF